MTKQLTEEEIKRLVPEMIWMDGKVNIDSVLDPAMFKALLQTRLDLENARKALERIANPPRAALPDGDYARGVDHGREFQAEIALEALEPPKDGER